MSEQASDAGLGDTAVPDEQLIAATRSGDLSAFESLIRRYQRMVDALTWRMSGTQADAADLAQETFIRAYQQLGSFRAESKFSSWLYRIGMNTCLNWQKSRQRRERLHGELAEQPVAADDTDPRSEDVQAALMRLPAKQRAAIILTVYDGMSHAEAARVLRCAETTVSWRLFIARKQLQKWLKGCMAQDCRTG